MDKIIDVNISKEMEKSFLDYSMSVIIQRALPDLRDGLKPVHRRILYTMYESGYTPDKQYQKSAKTVGAVIGNYHPHGDTAAYDSLVRMAQDFSYRYVLVDGHGNFGSIDGYRAAAMRYTESRLSKIATELLKDINKETVNFMNNYDGTRKEPEVLPSRYPNILVNGIMGIAVGMATNIPPHNLGEIIDGCIAYINNPDIDLLELMEVIKGPDFPGGGIILGNSGIKKAYETGKGTIIIRGKAEIEEVKNKNQIVIKEIPYQVNKTALKEKIAGLVRDKVIDGITDLRDETDLTQGIKIIIELKREANANVILNNLYKYTPLQTSYGINLLMLDAGQPKTLSLKEIITKYIDFQKEVIFRRTKFDLNKAENRAHILEGLKIALDNIDEIVRLIKKSKSEEEATNGLIDNFKLTEMQAKAILEMKLRRLTGLEREKIESELQQLLKQIEELIKILNSNQLVLDIIKKELDEIKKQYKDERRTLIDVSSIDFIEDESLIPVEDVVITITNKGYIKRVPVDTYRTQNRGGVGVKGITTNEEDYVEHLIFTTTHNNVLFFTNKGKVYKLKGYSVPEYSRQAKGIPIINILQIEKDEFINSVIKIDDTDEKNYLFFATKLGIVKRTELSEFDSIRKTGKIAITLKNNDELISVRKTNGANEIILGSSDGKIARFKEEEIRSMGRTAAGVRGINLGGNHCVGAEVVNNNEQILVVTEKGYGKRTEITEYRLTHRGSKGVKTLNVTDKNGMIVSFKSVSGDEDLIITTNSGLLIRLPMEQVSLSGRATQGVRLITLKERQRVTTVAKIINEG
ncbi:MAG: DNA gyrase subunit A [Bacilli bacterium]